MTSDRTALDQRSYLAEPEGAPAGGVLVVHDYYGLLPSVRECCDALAAAGFVAVAPDLYEGRVAGDDGEAERLMGDLEAAAARKRLGEAVGWLSTAVGGRTGAVGFSMGGSLALAEATAGTLDAVVAYYATLSPTLARSVACPVLLQLAEVDEWDPEETPERFLEVLREHGEAEELTYPGTQHSFANPGIPARFAPQAAATAWTRTVAFLERHLRS